MDIESLQALNLAADTLSKISQLSSEIDEETKEKFIDAVLDAVGIDKPKRNKHKRGELQQIIVDTLRKLEKATAKAIAESAELDKNAVSSSLNRMEEKGIVMRHPLEAEGGSNGRGRSAESVFSLVEKVK